jgi:hypothetical protein
MKGPGSIILIGMAVVFIVIGATDRAKDVWDAIRGIVPGADAASNTDSNTTGDSTDNKSPNPPDQGATQCTGNGEMEVTPVAGEAPYCCPSSEVGASSKGAICPRQYVQVTYYAVKGQTAIQYGGVRLNNCHARGSTNTGGYGQHVVNLQTGMFGFRHAPNV